MPNIRVPMSAEQERALFALRSAENIKPDEEKNFIKTKIRRYSGRSTRSKA